jgi:hypothetical protein
MAKIHGKEQRIGEVFSEHFAFNIPPYQRPYSWGLDQATELYDDIAAAAADAHTRKNGEPYFLGSIVLIKDEARPEAEVIDGQQRLTTLALLLSVLLRTLPADVTDGMRKLLYEKGNAVMGTKDRFRLRLRDRENEFFEQFILTNKSLDPIRALDPARLTDPKRKLRDNLLFFAERVQALSSEARQAFATYLVQNTFLIVVSTPSLESAFRIFSVLNDRGLDLTAADILKAEIIGAVAPADRDAYTKKWEDAEEELGTASFAELFSHIRFIHARKKQRETVLKEFREFVKAKDEPTRFIDRELVPYAATLEVIKHQSYTSTSGAELVNRYLRYLSRLDESDWVAPAILFHSTHADQTAALQRFYTDLERLASVMWLLSYDVNQRVERYGRLLAAISDGEDLSADGSPLQLTMLECSEAQDVLNGDIYNLSRKSKRTMILLRLDELLSSGEASYHFPLITIEHVLPQNPDITGKWATWWPNAERRKLDVHRLGNLVLLNKKQNSSAGNYDFEKKKRSYFCGPDGSSPFSLTTQVLKEVEWTPEVFDRRQKERKRPTGVLIGG